MTKSPNEMLAASLEKAKWDAVEKGNRDLADMLDAAIEAVERVEGLEGENDELLAQNSSHESQLEEYQEEISVLEEQVKRMKAELAQAKVEAVCGYYNLVTELGEQMEAAHGR